MKNIIFCIMISILFISCSSLKSITQEPEITFDSVRITNINFTSADFIFKYNVNNPNNVSINVNQFKYDLFIEGSKFISGTSSSPISIAKQSNSPLDVPVTINYQDLFNVYSNIHRQDTANYKLATEFTLNLPIFGRRVIPFEYSGTFPVIKPPEIALRDVKAVNINPLSATIEFFVDITNRNSFAISPDSLNFELYVNRSQWLNGLLKDIAELPANRSTTVKIPVDISIAKIGKELFDYIFIGNNLDVLLKGNMALRTSYPGIGSTEIPFSIEKTVPVGR